MSEIAEPARRGSEKAKFMTRAAVAHAAPFFIWIGVMLLAQFMHLTPSSGDDETPSLNLISDAGVYAVKTVLAALALLVLRPWRHYGRTSARNVLLGAAVGAAVFVAWVAPESDWFRSLCPSLANLYETWAVRPFGALRDAADAAASMEAYAPANTGWPLFALHVFGSGVVIALAEEFFWRGYLMRTVRTPDFLDIDAGSFHAASFLGVVALFAAEHTEVLGGALAGAVFALLLIKTRDIWCACAAHAVTNLLLAAYVPLAGHWQFW